MGSIINLIINYCNYEQTIKNNKINLINTIVTHRSLYLKSLYSTDNNSDNNSDNSTTDNNITEHNNSDNLINTLDMYRSLYLQNINGSKLNPKLVIQGGKPKEIDSYTLNWLISNDNDSNNFNSINNDYSFNRKNFITDMNSQDINIFKKFYQPKMIINNKNACLSRRNKIFIVCMIHSHRNNFIRRKTMRDTWLSNNKIKLFGKYFQVFYFIKIIIY